MTYAAALTNDPTNSPVKPESVGQEFCLRKGDIYLSFRPTGKRHNGADCAGVQVGRFVISAYRARETWQQMIKDGYTRVR